MIKPNPNINVVEDREKKPEPSIKDITLLVARVSQAIQFARELDCIERPLFFHKYPRLSRTYMVLFMVFVWTFNPRYFLSYILFFVLILFC